MAAEQGARENELGLGGSRPPAMGVLYEPQVPDRTGLAVGLPVVPGRPSCRGDGPSPARGIEPGRPVRARQTTGRARFGPSQKTRFRAGLAGCGPNGNLNAKI